MPHCIATFAPWMQAVNSACHASISSLIFPAPANRTSPILIAYHIPPSPLQCLLHKTSICIQFSETSRWLGPFFSPLLNRCSLDFLRQLLNSSSCLREIQAISSWSLLLSPCLTLFLSHYQLFRNTANFSCCSDSSFRIFSMHCLASGKLLSPSLNSPKPRAVHAFLAHLHLKRNGHHLHSSFDRSHILHLCPFLFLSVCHAKARNCCQTFIRSV